MFLNNVVSLVAPIYTNSQSYTTLYVADNKSFRCPNFRWPLWYGHHVRYCTLLSLSIGSSAALGITHMPISHMEVRNNIPWILWVRWFVLVCCRALRKILIGEHNGTLCGQRNLQGMACRMHLQLRGDCSRLAALKDMGWLNLAN